MKQQLLKSYTPQKTERHCAALHAPAGGRVCGAQGAANSGRQCTHASAPPLPPAMITRRQVDEYVENEAKEGLRQLAEASKEELQKLAELRDLQAEVAFNSALAGARVGLGLCDWAGGWLLRYPQRKLLRLGPGSWALLGATVAPEKTQGVAGLADARGSSPLCPFFTLFSICLLPAHINREANEFEERLRLLFSPVHLQICLHCYPRPAQTSTARPTSLRSGCGAAARSARCAQAAPLPAAPV